jgi:hypothetical protein
VFIFNGNLAASRLTRKFGLETGLAVLATTLDSYWPETSKVTAFFSPVTVNAEGCFSLKTPEEVDALSSSETLGDEAPEVKAEGTLGELGRVRDRTFRKSLHMSGA